jgi:predicted secreted protein
VKVQTTQYNTSPVYTKNVVTAWRARQAIRLESTDSDAISELIGELQERLSIGSIDYTVSKAARDAIENTLTAEALAQFKQRAELIARELGRKSYRIVQLHVSTQGGQPQPIAYAARGMVAMEAAVAPAIEAGVQTVTVHVSGTIEIDAGAM